MDGGAYNYACEVEGIASTHPTSRVYIILWPDNAKQKNKLNYLYFRFFVVIRLICTKVAAWCSGNALVVINEVTLASARLVLGWVTVCRRVNHLGM